MGNEIERIVPKMRQPDPVQTLQGIATMQAFTIGLLLATNIRLSIALRKAPVKEVVVIFKEAKGE